LTVNWRKSTYSGGSGGDCVEVGSSASDMVLVRDTKDNGAGPVLRVSPETWRMFTGAIRASAPTGLVLTSFT
jgi:hypothetical protein